MALILPAAGLAATLGLAGCGASPLAGAGSDLADEAVALQQVGFDTGLQDTPDPSASASASTKVGAAPKMRRKAIRQYLRKNTLHGEVTVQTKNGPETIVVQRGSVTAVSSTSVSVKSTDGYTLTWTLADKATIVQDKKKVAASALKAGAQIGIAGTKDGSADDARLIAIK
jgi:hypothetical protein